MNSALAVYSPVAEAEQANRLAAAFRALDDFVHAGVAAALHRVSGPAVARHLDGALHVLSDEGWTQGHMRDENGVCLFKALYHAAELGWGDSPEQPGIPFDSTTNYVAGRYLDLMVAVRTGQLDSYLVWNDASGRTRDEVMELVQDAAAFARSYVPAERPDSLSCLTAA